ncbi:4-hydroxy-3-methylbut-2-enyl diphosphate reductase [Geosporobacter subterraneus DSM 17957]|uniref:4-hydroxy-3-methylbut-2-enyl diphosphate reductase n=1 Tax=Geosporobacter subterraneus DSM 17957 TaxID=1121919 RepID=A0A1M6K8E8_9FIRM|nr:bifunctional 4-hydroxy-3-methylbut-2-enyl diphosphate reductase/30S ribosomal protein S1 [Geosporobacter subterraneus]SHJ55183.1 4-hydroxy-3-methylbut-2-enyl diphosphate reductase [Geosporobacter subterraneus DSM 17957]
MKIILARNAGYCFGVKEAMQKTFNAVDLHKDKQIYTYGPLIHNPQVVQKLESMGVQSIDDIQDGKNSIVIIRSHGIPLEVYEKAKANHVEIIDATCPFVRKVQRIVHEYHQKGYSIVIIGDPNHPEVIGINGWCENKAHILNHVSQVESLPFMDKLCIVAQTTITSELWNAIVEELEHKAAVVEPFNTICIATRERQSSCASVAQQVDAMIVIGGYHSSNTQKLLQISEKYCKYTYHVETAEDLPMDILKKMNKIGVTAGASTPDWIIKEVIEKMSSMDQNNNEMMNMMEEIENSLRVPRRGQTIKGKVIHVTDSEIMVNIGYKSDGIIPKQEISNDLSVNPRELVKEGDEIEVYVLKTDDGEGNVLLSKKRIDAEKGWETLGEAVSKGTTLQAKVVEVVKGGVIAVINELRGFIPASQLSTSYVNNLNDFLGKQLAVNVIDFNRDKRKIVFSHRSVLEKENVEKRRTLWQNIQKGNVIEGEVKRLTNFGAFVDIGGIDGLIHISDLSWGRISQPSEVVKVGDHIKVVVLDFDQDKNKISLGLKQITQEPWENIHKKYNAGDIVEGKVVRLADFGAFVELEPGLDGLVHISQISNKHIAKPSQEVHIGQKVNVKILEINEEAKRISLSIKEANEPETVEIVNQEEPTTIGDIVESKDK